MQVRRLLKMAAAPEDMTQYDWFSQGRIYETTGDDQKAIEAYEESIRIDPEFAKAWFFKAKLHFKLGQVELARDCARRVIELEPKWEKYVKYLIEL
jgi:tetratricopeptide (TPR) repeat protein